MTNLIDDEESAAALGLNAHEFHALTLYRVSRRRGATATPSKPSSGVATTPLRTWNESRTVF